MDYNIKKWDTKKVCKLEETGVFISHDATLKSPKQNGKHKLQVTTDGKEEQQ